MLVIFIFLPLVYSFGLNVHGIIGQMVQDNINTDVFQVVQGCNYTSNFSTASVWADKVKYTNAYKWTRTLHYYDIENNPPEYCSEFRVSDINTNTRNLFTFINDTLSVRNKNECNLGGVNFKILLHLLQDMHQPLHLTGKERGGNGEKYNSHYSLHAFWDHVLYDIFLERNNLKSLSSQVVFWQSILDKDEETCDDINISTIVEWANEISRLNCILVWRYRQLNYIEKSIPVLVKLISVTIRHSICMFEHLYDSNLL